MERITIYDTEAAELEKIAESNDVSVAHIIEQLCCYLPDVLEDNDWVREKKLDMLQFTVDVEDNEEFTGSDLEILIQEALLMAGLKEVSVSWKARWTHDGYFNGKPPISSN